MKYNFKFLFLLLLFFSLLAFNAKKNHKKFYVNVLLDEKKISDTGEWKILSDTGFLLSDNADNESKIFATNINALHIYIKNNAIYINDKKYLRKQIKIVPRHNDLSFSDNFYQGYFIIALIKKKLLLINRLNLEDYVYAVLRSETWPGWPLEVNKVFAVAIRTYAISKILETKKTERLYHVKNDNRHQTYNGYKFHVRNSSVLRKAVEKTKGMFIGYEGKPIIAMFDSCCGGIVPAFIDGFVDFTKAPYLKRNYCCKYCRKCSLYNWEVEYSLDDFMEILSNVYPAIKGMRAIWISKKDKAGVVKGVMVKGKKHSWSIIGDKLYSLLKDVKSFCFNVKKTGNCICFKGRGYGHHIGLCQWGARQMVRELHDYEQILQFYYPGTEFMWLG